MFKKRIAAVILFAVILLISAIPANALTLNVNGTSLDCYAENGITYTSVRSFSQLYEGYEVSWDQETQRAKVNGNGLELSVYLNKYYSVANNRCLMRDGLNSNVGGRVYAPVTVLAKAVGADVFWDGATSTVTVKGGGDALIQGTSYYSEDDLYWLSRIIHAESGGESFMGKCAVGNVVLNRVESAQFPNSIKEVIFDKNYGVQFSPAANGTIYNTPSEDSVLAAKACLDGFMKSDAILYFLNPRTASNFWIVNNRSYAFTIGNHDFYA
ncbi:MAG: cell wall hydrolase [Clostridia bacterium]|nr:cell wall hydrolase [Clostridia bacterium]